MYQIADSILQTDGEVVFVGQHKVDFDYQTVYLKTIGYYLESRTADIDASDHLTYITTAKFNPITQNGNAVGFISNWQEKVRNYNKLVNNKDEELSFKIQHSLLKNAVHGVEPLWSVQDTSDQLKVNTGVIQTFEQYCSQLIASATSYDNLNKPKSFSSNRPNNNNRRVYQHDINDQADYLLEDSDFNDQTFDFNTDIHEIHAYSTKMNSFQRNKNQPSLLLLSIYEDMNDQSRSAWRKIDPDIRSRIIKLQ